MKKSLFIYIISISLIATVFSCKKHDAECMCGSDGNLTVKVFLQHSPHQVVNLKNYRDTVYIKYNTRDYPGSNPSVYDKTFIGDWPGDFVTIPNLACGNYFFYAVGYESVHSYRVAGGIPFSTEKNEGEQSITIPVSE